MLFHIPSYHEVIEKITNINEIPLTIQHFESMSQDIRRSAKLASTLDEKLKLAKIQKQALNLSHKIRMTQFDIEDKLNSA